MQYASEDAELFVMRAQAHESLEKYLEAKQDFESARTIAPWNKVAADGMNRLRSMTAVATAHANNDADAAKAKGNEFFSKGDSKRAYDMYSKAIELNSLEFVYYGNRAAAAIKLERFSDALSDCEEALRLGTSATTGQQTKFYFRKASALQGMNRISDAQAAIESGLQLDSKSAQLLQLKGKFMTSVVAEEAAPAKPKLKKKIVIEEVDSSVAEEAAPAPVAAAAKPKKKKKIVIEEVDSSVAEEAAPAPVVAAAAKPKKKKKI